MTTIGNLENTIWYQLDIWAQDFKPWQRFVLANAIRSRCLTHDQITNAYDQFLYDNDLKDSSDLSITIPTRITGRPTSIQPKPIWLKRIKDLHGINALPTTAELIFSSQLTVVYGRNGAGKSGFTRILSNTCFSRTQHSILPNVYDDEVINQTTASITITDDTQKEQIFLFDGSTEYEELKRIAIFDTAVARARLVEQSPLEFKPAGFDIFPEMAKVYRELASLLEADISNKTTENTLTNSFIGSYSPISEIISRLNPDTDIEELRRFAVFGQKELARLAEIHNQLNALRSRSIEQTIEQLESAKGELFKLQSHLTKSQHLLSDEKRQNYRTQLEDFTNKNRAATAFSTKSFEQDFFNNIGTPEWETFLQAAYKLGQLENNNYPRFDDHCLLCHRPLDRDSVDHIKRFWRYLTDEVRLKAEQAAEILELSVNELKGLHLDFFSSDTIVRDHLIRLNPEVAALIDQHIETMKNERITIISILENKEGDIRSASFNEVNNHLNSLAEQIDKDLKTLKEMKVEDAIKTLESEFHLLQHRQVLKQLLPAAEKYVNDLKWVKKASGTPRQSLNPLPLTMKEKELFAMVIETNYRNLFESECAKLSCNVPVELLTHGERGQTVRQLKIKKLHSPEKILSEGEQRVVAIADFLTEIALNPANTGIILDDPVTSLDHQFRTLIAKRLVEESNNRQVIIFTHDLVFLTMLVDIADKEKVKISKHWIERDNEGRPGQISLNDSPTTTPQYRKTTKAREILIQAKSATGSNRFELIQNGMDELRRTVEEIIPHHLLKQVVNRWSDRIIVGALKKVKWSEQLADSIVTVWEELSAYNKGHTHTEELIGAPPELHQLETMITRVDGLIAQAKKQRDS